jgi:hypothetical protein
MPLVLRIAYTSSASKYVRFNFLVMHLDIIYVYIYIKIYKSRQLDFRTEEVKDNDGNFCILALE